MSLFMQWLLIGVVLTILELIIPGTYLIWFGFAVLVMAGIVYCIPDISLLAQLVSVGFLSVGFALLGWKVYGRLIFRVNMPEEYKKLNDPVAQLMGKVVTVTAVKEGKYQVAVGDTVWMASSDDDLKRGDKVIISGSYNNVELKVKKYLDKKIKKV